MKKIILCTPGIGFIFAFIRLCKEEVALWKNDSNDSFETYCAIRDAVNDIFLAMFCTIIPLALYLLLL